MGAEDRKKDREEEKNKTSDSSPKSTTEKTNPLENRNTSDNESVENRGGSIEKKESNQKPTKETFGEEKSGKISDKSTQQSDKTSQSQENIKEVSEEKDMDITLDNKPDEVKINVNLKKGTSQGNSGNQEKRQKKSTGENQKYSEKETEEKKEIEKEENPEQDEESKPPEEDEKHSDKKASGKEEKQKEHDDHSAQEEDHKGKKSEHGEHHHKHMLKDFKKRFWFSLIIAIPILALSEMIQTWFGYELAFTGSKYVLGGLGLAIYIYGGWPFLKGMKREIQDRYPGMMTLIAVAITVAWAYSFAITLGMEGVDFYWELATLVVIMLLGHWLEMKSILGASRALEELMELMPDTAHRIKENGDTEEVKVTELKNGDRILIKPGEKIAADGAVVEGKSSVNESMLTGESKPVEKKKGDEVIGGAVNESGSLTVEIERTGEESYLNQMVDMVKEAQKSKSKTQRLADKAALILTIVALTGGLATFLVWFLVMERELVFAIERAVTVMIIACPHALGLAIPLVVAISTSISAKQGLLIRNRSAFEMCRKLDVVLFDKTGTLTKGEFGVTTIESLDEEWDEEMVLTWVASVERKSEHPLAAGILKKAKEKDLELLDVEDYENITGQGIRSKINGKKVIIAGGTYLKEKNIPTDAKPDIKGTVIYLVVDDEPKGYLALADEVRADSKEAVKTLHDNDIEVYMITGDSEQVAKEVSEELGIEGYFANVLPEKKQDKIKEFQKKGKIVAMTGDGVNDAPALAQADVGIAVGSGTDVAAETADIILANSNPKDIVKLILFGKATYNKMIQNLFWATAYNIVAIPLAAGVLYKQGILVNPAIGAIVMSISTIIVAVNAQLLRYKLK
ncbi:copper-translocating P-type ATPase [Gillisia sp. Q332]|uniref:copper-translocating P-type ATPase n=1 Tax=Gillisia xinjiangensis TaxID=3384765 RepID=UPI00391D01CA